MISSVLTVSQVNVFIKSLIEGDGRLSDFFVVGEISNFTSHYKSGHLYFSLKDEKSTLKSVMFKGATTRLKFMPEDGMRVIVRGRVSVYEPSGQYQLYAEDMQPDGLGALAMAFEQLKEKLEKEGLFDEEVKKDLPLYPQKIGVITSKTGAALQDILQITGRRWPLAEILLCPVLVQGENASQQLTSAVKTLNIEKACDVIIIGRGGGSYEDLQAFNDEKLARAIFASEIPIISAVGHETDFTICDFVADLRAPTPSAAAELTTPNIDDEKRRLESYSAYFTDGSRAYIDTLKQALDLMIEETPIAMPDMLYRPQKELLDERSIALSSLLDGLVTTQKQQLAVYSEKLDALSPLKVLARGYSIVEKDKKNVNSIKDVKLGDILDIKLNSGLISAEVKEIKEEN